ncbi:glycosylphosphatidylinositol anchor biosynthesis [Knufia peltigerae]|uniref:Mannosyltransferase n=1 Tax=Knufia peltigerae TaxID=1002370 RepID=A0AA38XS00_9EURO|nr:glycosylphosphatidylinositol anchor biosynthesis [Knufia peltigerae]
MSEMVSKSKQVTKDVSQDDQRATSAPSTLAASVPFALDAHTVFVTLVAFRLLNALTICTFFQPDEYFQALEPAWRWAFGKEAGAWITWEWNSNLRSALHPAVFGVFYQTANFLAEALSLGSHTRSEVLLATPKVVQAFFAAVGDYFTWKLGSYIYGKNTVSSLIVLLLTVVSPWQWFCSTRTFSNSMESTMTIIALYNWPWHWMQQPLTTGGRPASTIDSQGLRVRELDSRERGSGDELTRLRRALLCAAVATILRPTNIFIWFSLASMAFFRFRTSAGPSWTESTIFIRETILCGSTVLIFSSVVDRIFYDAWVFPPLNFLHVNVIQSLATFYGSNDWHYYLSQGYPLLLMTALPFTLIGMCRVLRNKVAESDATPTGVITLRSLTILCILVPALFSNIAHKEVRFIYPLLPALHIITAVQLSRFFGPLVTESSRAGHRASKRLLLFFLLALNVGLAYYTSYVHNSGIISLTHYLRNEFEDVYLGLSQPSNMTLGMLMPCHSTPWRSHFQYPPTAANPGIRAWALTCEPPLGLDATEKATYMDEADQFYDNPTLWLKRHMSRRAPRRKEGVRARGDAAGVFAKDPLAAKRGAVINDSDSIEAERDEQYWNTGGEGRKPWPDYLVAFAHLDSVMTVALRGSGYVECRRFWNSHWHDDWRRTGDVVVWCLDGTSRAADARDGKVGSFENLDKHTVRDSSPPGGEGKRGQKVLGQS